MDETKIVTIESIDIPSMEELDHVPLSIRSIRIPYFTRSVQKRYNPPTLVRVGNSGHFYNNTIPGSSRCAVRPILTIKELQELKLDPFIDELEIFGEPYIYIGDNKVLKKDVLFKDRIFDSINYEDSAIKKQLDSWLQDKLED